MDAQATDLVLIAGKGHECWQEIGGERLPFSDLEQASRTLARWAAQSHARSLTGTHQSAPRSAELGLPEPTDPPMRGLFTLRQAQGWLSSSALHCAGDVWVSEVVTDSRRVVPGCLFVALTGERFDGHDFIAQAQTQGAAAVIFERWRPGIALPALRVPDARRALSEIACGWRKQFNLPLASVAGSNGKTTVKEMLASIGRAAVGADAVLWSHGNDNNDIGVPQTLLRLREHHRLAVLELGMNHPGELAGLAATARPTVALVNNAQREHQEFIAGTEASARENASSFAFLAEPGTAVFPGDDPVHSPIWREMSAASSRLQFGLVDTFDQRDPLLRVCALREAQADGFTILVEHQAIEVRLAIAGAHNVRNALAAAACAHAMGVDAAAIRAGLEAFRPVAGRLAERRGPQGSRLIDDTYNANPDSVRAAIDVLAASGERSILILGDMGEVGEQGPQWHAEVGAYARDRGIAVLMALGEATRASVAAFGASGRHFETVDALLADAALRIDSGTVTLVKGSRFMRMERVVAALAAGEAH
jgi:UDP-N-acetylmuramoyl-tripeptide--D-alanyl-D-alanine ligase